MDIDLFEEVFMSKDSKHKRKLAVKMSSSIDHNAEIFILVSKTQVLAMSWHKTVLAMSWHLSVRR
jgi:hypothetical protein